MNTINQNEHYETVRIVATKKFDQYMYTWHEMDQPIIAKNADDVIADLKTIYPKQQILGMPGVDIRNDVRHRIHDAPEYLIMIESEEPHYLGIKKF